MSDTNDTRRWHDEPEEGYEVECHVTSVRRLAVGVGRSDGGTGIRYQATCTICGPFGPREIHVEDVQCIADRHALVGGFER